MRIGRYTWLVTLVAFVVLAQEFGVAAGAALLAIELSLTLGVALVAWRVSGARREFLLGVLLPPIARRLLAAEWRILCALPAGLIERRADRRAGAEVRFAYRRGSSELAFGVALLPALLAELVIVHLLLAGAPEVVRWTLTLLSLYAMLWVIGFITGLVLLPHRVHRGEIAVRFSALHLLRLRGADVVDVQVFERRDGDRSGVLVDGREVRFQMGGRTNVRLDLGRPTRLVRPIAAPVDVTTVFLWADDSEAFCRATEQARRPGVPRP